MIHKCNISNINSLYKNNLARFIGTIIFVVLIASSCKNENNLNKHEEEAILGLQITTSPATGQTSEPYLFSNDRTVFMSWVEKQNDSLHALLYAEATDNNWTIPDTIATGNDWFINWADYPTITENNGQIMAHFLQKSAPGTYTYNIKYTHKLKNSLWGIPETLNIDSTLSEHGFVSVMPFRDSFIASWLDGRKTITTDKAESQMTLRGAIIDSSGWVKERFLLDDRVCDCCQTSVAITSNGPIVVYRDRSEDDDEIRDISIVRWQDSTWSKPEIISKDNWHLKGCPVNGPRADAYKNSLAVAWFTAANEKPKIQIVFSRDGGATFDPPIRLDGGKPIGRVDIAMINEKTAVVSWLETKNDEDVILAIKVDADGVRSTPVAIASSSSERASGFPQMALLNDNLYFAWTAILDEKSSVVTGILPLAAFD
ncbi:MAG: hypothetical protein V7767_01965 [Leeuwenhoekiella sp.]